MSIQGEQIVRQKFSALMPILDERSRRLWAAAEATALGRGGSNGYRVRLWKTELQRFATEQRLEVSVSHFPPGASKWNKIEHRMFSHISMNWRGKPLTSHEVIVNLIANTTTAKGKTEKAAAPDKQP